jgi:hypothetical protein
MFDGLFSPAGSDAGANLLSSKNGDAWSAGAGDFAEVAYSSQAQSEDDAYLSLVATRKKSSALMGILRGYGAGVEKFARQLSRARR